MTRTILLTLFISLSMLLTASDYFCTAAHSKRVIRLRPGTHVSPGNEPLTPVPTAVKFLVNSRMKTPRNLCRHKSGSAFENQLPKILTQRGTKQHEGPTKVKEKESRSIREGKEPDLNFDEISNTHFGIVPVENTSLSTTDFSGVNKTANSPSVGEIVPVSFASKHARNALEDFMRWRFADSSWKSTEIEFSTDEMPTTLAFTSSGRKSNGGQSDNATQKKIENFKNRMIIEKMTEPDEEKNWKFQKCNGQKRISKFKIRASKEKIENPKIMTAQK
ncbi:hypothetical protein CEXT_603951 [Caerostris extrusa]|uniref:Uncharacterized protein n=1 Tax=Caerostris extrusa TaxID=172846 RepID=A0AAV4STM9_CAEEX|nr:hypothetical protein CEXT_603951 [Caerostris extrusa]